MVLTTTTDSLEVNTVLWLGLEFGFISGLKLGGLGLGPVYESPYKHRGI